VCIYPMYDFAHGQCDSIEGITHIHLHAGVEDHAAVRLAAERAGNLPSAADRVRPAQLSYTVMSKRKLLATGARQGRGRLGDPACRPVRHAPARLSARKPSANFAARVGVAKNTAWWTLTLLEHCAGKTEQAAPRRYWRCCVPFV